MNLRGAGPVNSIQVMSNGEQSTFINQKLSDYQIAIYNLMQEQINDEAHPLGIIGNEISR